MGIDERLLSKTVYAVGIGSVDFLRKAAEWQQRNEERKDIKDPNPERPNRAIVSEKKSLKRMKDFSKRKEQFLATARTGKSRGVRS